jgi:hypothetical protein
MAVLRYIVGLIATYHRNCLFYFSNSDVIIFCYSRFVYTSFLNKRNVVWKLSDYWNEFVVRTTAWWPLTYHRNNVYMYSTGHVNFVGITDHGNSWTISHVIGWLGVINSLLHRHILWASGMCKNYYALRNKDFELIIQMCVSEVQFSFLSGTPENCV